MEFFNNKENDTLKFKLNSEGIDINNIEPRLILKTKKNNNLIIFGKVEEGNCYFDVPELDMYENKDNGKVIFEIISEDVYFNVWSDDFEVKTKPTVKLEKQVENIKNESKKSINLDSSPTIVKKQKAQKIFENIEEVEKENTEVVVDTKEDIIEKEKEDEEKTEDIPKEQEDREEMKPIVEKYEDDITIDEEVVVDEKLNPYKEFIPKKTKKLEKDPYDNVIKFESFMKK